VVKIKADYFNRLTGITAERQVVLFEGNQYLDGSSTYSLWNESLHEDWDYVDLHIAYDSGALAVVIERRYLQDIPMWQQVSLTRY